MTYKVLLVDDDPRVLRFLALTMKHAGHEPVSCTSGEEAIELANSARPDIVLLDMLMPGMDGFEVLQKIRAFSAVPVIATSRLLESRERAIALGANAFAEKPFNLDALISLIRTTLETGADTAPPS